MYGYAIKETTSTEGTGTIELDGAVGTGFFTFRDQFTSGSKVVFVIASVGSDGDGDREIVEGTLTHGTPDTLTRDKVLASTNSGSKVNWGPGQKVVFCDFAADYTPADRTAESIASASTTSIGNAAGNFVHITGTTTITSFGTAAVAGRRVTVTFDGALTLTHGSNLVLPGAANITTAAGDIATFRADTTTKWVCESYTKANGQAVVVGGWTLISEATPSGAATVDFAASLDETYDDYMVIFDATPANDDVPLCARVGTGAGPTWQSGASAYQYGARVAVPGGGADELSTGNTLLVLSRSGTGNGVGNAAGEHIAGTLFFSNPNTAQFPVMSWATRWIRSDGVPGSAHGAGSYMTAGAITGVRLFFSTGNIASGVFRLYGLRKS